MSENQIDAGGPALDRLIAQAVGWELWPNWHDGFDDYDTDMETVIPRPLLEVPVMGVRVPPGGRLGVLNPYQIDQWHDVPPYSTSVASAWRVVEYMCETHQLSWGVWGTSPFSSVLGGILFRFQHGIFPPEWHNEDHPGRYAGFGPTLPLAIGRAALAVAHSSSRTPEQAHG